MLSWKIILFTILRVDWLTAICGPVKKEKKTVFHLNWWGFLIAAFPVLQNTHQVLIANQSKYYTTLCKEWDMSLLRVNHQHSPPNKSSYNWVGYWSLRQEWESSDCCPRLRNTHAYQVPPAQMTVSVSLIPLTN